MKPSFKRTINWNEYQAKVANPYLDYLTDPSFQGVYRFFVLSLENTRDRTVHDKYFLPSVEIKDYNIMVNRKNFFSINQ